MAVYKVGVLGSSYIRLDAKSIDVATLGGHLMLADPNKPLQVRVVGDF